MTIAVLDVPSATSSLDDIPGLIRCVGITTVVPLRVYIDQLNAAVKNHDIDGHFRDSHTESDTIFFFPHVEYWARDNRPAINQILLEVLGYNAIRFAGINYYRTR